MEFQIKFSCLFVLVLGEPGDRVYTVEDLMSDKENIMSDTDPNVGQKLNFGHKI